MFVIYDNKKKYDLISRQDILRYDYSSFKIIVNLMEILKLSEYTNNLLFNILIRETFSLSDLIEAEMQKKFLDDFYLKENQKANALISLLEKLNILDLIFYVLVNLSIYDNNLNLKDDALALNLIINEESFNIKEISNVNAFKELLEKNNFDDFLKLIALIEKFENIDFTENPRTAETDYYIGRSSNIDPRFTNCLVPFDLKIDMRNSTLDVMPPTQTTTLEIPYNDGDVDVDTVYQSRLYNIVAYSVDGLTIEQKEAMKTKIVNILDETKNKTKKLTFGRNNLTFDAKYVGGSNVIEERGSFIKAEIPFKLSPYGYNQFTNEFEGNGIIVNNGKTDLGAFITINSGCVNPNFLIGDVEFLWSGVIPAEKKLIIDNEDESCYLIDDFGVQTQAMTQLVKGYRFKTVLKNSSATLTCLNESTLNSIHTEYRPYYLWQEAVTDNEPTGQNFNVLRT